MIYLNVEGAMMILDDMGPEYEKKADDLRDWLDDWWAKLPEEDKSWLDSRGLLEDKE